MPEVKEETKPKSEEKDNNTSTLKKDTETDTIAIEDKWMIRECEIYKDEYKECTSFKGRFHQYFIYGQSLDCNQWKKDYNNCCKWEDDKDVKAAQTLILSEKKRRLERLKGHVMNDTWKRRESPPTDWSKPLPEWMVKRDENTYLAHKAQEIKEGKVEESDSFCTIM